MSVTVASLRARVRSNLHEMDARKPIGVIYLDQQIRNAYLSMMAKLPAPYSYTASAGTIAVGALSFTLPTTSSAEYAGDFRIQLTSDSQFLMKLSQEEIQRLRNGGSSSGRPRFFAPYEASDQSVICWVYPSPTSTETYNLFRTLVAADFSSTDISATTLAIGRNAQIALVNKISAAIARTPWFLRGLDPDIRAAVRETAAGWDAEGDRLIYLETDRLHGIESVGRTQRFQA